MKLEDTIVSILLQAGDDGLSIKKISRHVFNDVNSLFVHFTLEEVQRQVAACIKKNSRNSYSLFERTSVRGRYRLNKKYENQLRIEFTQQ